MTPGYRRRRYAATGDLTTARARMIDATPPDAFIGRAALKKTPISQALQDQINNALWTNATYALNWAGGDSEIRAGVLRLLFNVDRLATADSGQHLIADR